MYRCSHHESGRRSARPAATTPRAAHRFDYWKLKLASILPKVDADAIVNDLGIDDTFAPGTGTTPGYSLYDQKVDWFMDLVGGKPVSGSNLPCAIEPPDLMTGCKAVNHTPVRWLATGGRT